MQTWWSRPTVRVYVTVFIGAVMVKIHDGQVRNRPIYVAIRTDRNGHKDVLSMWAGDKDGESATFWMAVLTRSATTVCATCSSSCVMPTSA